MVLPRPPVSVVIYTDAVEPGYLYEAGYVSRLESGESEVRVHRGLSTPTKKTLSSVTTTSGVGGHPDAEIFSPSI